MPFVNITLSASNKAPESMKTKTGQLLMRRHQNRSSSPALMLEQGRSMRQSVVIAEPKEQRWKGRHISHVNEYNFVNIVNKRPEGLASRQDLKNLQIQNLRLIEENMRLTEWTHNLLNKLRQGTMRAIQAIEQFRYLEGVNLLYTFLAEMTEYDDNEFKLPRRPELVDQNQLLKRLAGAQTTKALFFNPDKLQICGSVYNVRITCSDKQPQHSLFIGYQKLGLPQSHSGEQGQNYLRMLMAQARGIEQYLIHNSEFS